LHDIFFLIKIDQVVIDILVILFGDAILFVGMSIMA
jgi:hypothetical protein